MSRSSIFQVDINVTGDAEFFNGNGYSRDRDSVNQMAIEDYEAKYWITFAYRLISSLFYGSQRIDIQNFLAYISSKKEREKSKEEKFKNKAKI
jgi:hypothetical protein